MTRRKRTPSPTPSSPQKRVAFEIPASLQQFSTISRSLATNRDSHASPLSQPSASSSQTQPRPSPQSSFYSHAPLSTETRNGDNAPPQFIPPQRWSTGAEAWQQPAPRNRAHPGVSEHVEGSGQVPSAASGSPPFPAAQSGSAVAAPSPGPQARRPSMPAEPASTVKEEPALKPGETPTLTTHPNLIASLMAKKREENEAKGMRELWARRQAAYQSSRSPASQLMNELNTEAGRNEVSKPQPRAASNAVSAQPPPGSKASYLLSLSRIESRTPAEESASTPASASSAKSVDTPKAITGNENDSLFGSPFMSPMAEFLEKATDNAGLKDGTEAGGVVSNRPPPSRTPVPDAPKTTPSQPRDSKNTSKDVTIPPLFSDKPKATQAAPQAHAYLGGLGPNVSMSQNNSAAIQRQHQLNSSVAGQYSAARRASFVSTTPSAGSHSSPLPQRHPYFQQTPSPGGYFKVDFQTPAGSSNSGSMPTNFAMPYAKPAAQADPAYSGYPMGMLPMYPMAQPMQGRVSAYGANTGAMVAQAPQQPKQQPFNANSITAADMVAGINTRFKISTQQDFVVPKR